MANITPVKNVLSDNRLPGDVGAFLLFFIRKYQCKILLMLSTAFIYASCQALIPFTVKVILNLLYDRSLHENHFSSSLMIVLLILFVFWLVMQSVINVQGYFVANVLPCFKSSIKQALFEHIVSYKYNYLISLNINNLKKKLNEISHSSERVVQLFIFNLFSIVMAFLVSSMILMHVSMVFALLMLSWISGHFYLMYKHIQKGAVLESKYVESMLKSSSYVADAFDNFINIKLFNAEEFEKSNISLSHQQESIIHQKVLNNFEIMKILQNICTMSYIFSTIGCICYLWSRGKISVGDFTMIFMLSFSSINIVWQLSNHFITFIREIETLKSNLDIIKDHAINERNKKHEPVIGKFVFKDVSFGYYKDKPIINNLSLIINPGDKIGIVGKSGIGKTTIIKLLLGLHDQDSGSILIGDKEISEIDKNMLYDKISMVNQDMKLLNRSIKDNILYGNRAATEEELYFASTTACCHEFICALPNGYDTIIGENGITLSGGQRQRIALARMIIRNAPIVIMDEPSSALDSATEQQICSNLSEYFQNKTVIVISHSSRFLQLITKVYKFENGTIITDHVNGVLSA